MKRFALPKSCLLRKSGEYNLVYRNGRRLRGHGFMLVCCASDQPFSRLGISVPGKTGCAVRRNRIKRLIRETFRLNRQLFPAASDIVVAVRPEFTLNGMSEVRAAIARLTGMPEPCDAQPQA
jgi:ribonuclease P protein component